MIACVDVMIDNDDKYDDWIGIFRKLPTGDRYSRDDIDGIVQAAIECVDIVDMLRHTK